MSLNKIYSRPRIRFPKGNFKPKDKKQKIKNLIIWIIIIIIIILIIIFKTSYPIFIASCESEASSKAVSILNDEVSKEMVNYDYDDLVNIEKTESGEVSYIEAKIVPINKLVSEITNNIQEQIDNTENITVKLNLGTISGISSLALISPSVRIKMESSGRIETDIESSFEAVGINQTLHRIYLNLKCKISILTPFKSVSKTVESDILLTETVIVGEVPETYYFYDNLGFEDILDTN